MKLYSISQVMVDSSNKPYFHERRYYVSRDKAIEYFNECIELLKKGEYKHPLIDHIEFKLSGITKNHDGTPRIAKGRSFPSCIETEVYMIELETID